MNKKFPVRANLEWLKRQSKTRLRALQQDNPGMTLADAQKAVSSDYGFADWPSLKMQVERIQSALANARLSSRVGLVDSAAVLLPRVALFGNGRFECQQLMIQVTAQFP